MRRVLVTGASGFVGRQALGPLAALGFEVVGLSRRPMTGRHVVCDLRDAAAVRAVLAEVRPSHVLHCAWDVAHGRFWGAGENLDHAAATLGLARACAGVARFVGVGSSAEYDWTGDDHPRRESDPARPATLYGVAKESTRAMLAGYFAGVGVGFAWARLFHLFGPGEQAGRFVPGMIAAFRAGAPFVVREGGVVCDYMTSPDAGAALAALVDCDVVGTVNVGSGGAVSLGDFARRVAGVFGAEGLLTVGAESPARRMIPDLSRLRGEVGVEESSFFEKKEAKKLLFDWFSGG